MKISLSVILVSLCTAARASQTPVQDVLMHSRPHTALLSLRESVLRMRHPQVLLHAAFLTEHLHTNGTLGLPAMQRLVTVV